MPLLDVSKQSFSSGELSQKMLARADVDRYKNAAVQLENWEVLVQGGVRRRWGLRYIAEAGVPATAVLVFPFEPSEDEAYILEAGNTYFRFYKDTARIESPPGTPVQVTTPYTAAQLRLIRTAQSNDVMLLVHSAHAPRRLSRLSDTSWVFSLIPFRPPPTFEAGHVGTHTLTLSATSGTSITVTAGGAFFLPADVQRQITAGVGRAIITAYTSATVVTASVVDTFATTSFAIGGWTIQGSPVAQLTIDKVGPPGAEVTLTLGARQTASAELVAHGTFDAGLTGWTNLSGGIIASGVHDGGDDQDSYSDVGGTDLVAAGVKPTMIVHNTTDGGRGVIASVHPYALLVADPGMLGGTQNDFDNGDVVQIRETGSATAGTAIAFLAGGTAGHGWIEQGIATASGVTYEVQFTVSGQPLAFMVGSSSGIGNLLAEATYLPAVHTVQFTAAGTTSYLGFRNNQPSSAGVTSITAKVFTIGGWRTSDVGSYVKIHDAIILLRTFVSPSVMKGEIIRETANQQAATATAVPHAWTLEASAWSDGLGWPTVIALYEGRLFLGGSPRFPQTLWGSAVDDFFNFGIGANPADAVEYSLVDSGGNIRLIRILWLMPAENLLIGTTNGEYRLVGAGDDPLSATSLPRNRIQSTYGSARVQPVKVGGSVLLAQRKGSKIREMSYDERSQTSYLARDVTVTSDHLLETYSVLEMTYQAEPLSTVRAVRSDGTCLNLAFDPGEQVAAWWRMTTTGQIESCAVIPHPTRQAHQVWMVVRRTMASGVTRFIEVLDPYATMTYPVSLVMHNDLTEEDETQTGWEGLTLDCATIYNAISTATLTGLARFNGMTVSIIADGAVLPDQEVSGGQLVLPRIVQSAFVGLSYRALGKTVPIDAPVRGHATSQMVRKRWVELRARVERTANLVLHGERVFFRQPHMPMDQGVGLYTGDVEVTPLGWSGLGLISFVSDQPLPSTVIGIYGTLDQEVRQ